MKMHINRRNFLLSSLGTTVTVIAPLNVKANPSSEQQEAPKYIQCGKMTSTDLRHFYYKEDNKENKQPALIE